MPRYLAEFIGTFFLVLTIGMTVIGAPSGVIPPLAIGAVLLVMVYAGGHISGAHYNPAVTLAVWMRGKCPTTDVPGYMIAQVAGAVTAAILAIYLMGSPEVTVAAPDVFRWLVAEFVFTFALAYVVLNVATAKETDGNSYFGLAIGFTVMAGAFAMGAVAAAAFNPAVAIGLIAMGKLAAADIWIFLIANFAGGALAAIVFRLLHPDTTRERMTNDE
ncbi:MAG: aquaporin [Pirellulales bacterium]